MERYLQAIILGHLMLGAVGLNLKDLFSCKHTSNVFAKVARKDPGHKMQLVGGLRDDRPE